MTALADLLIALRFLSRLPVPATDREAALGAGGLAAAVIMVPVAGAIIGLGPAAMLVALAAWGVAPPVAGAAALAALVAVTGALHEDGLADCADGFGGGGTREHKLAIMRDSRLGTYGACALALSLVARAAALASLGTEGPAMAMAAIVATAALSRGLAMLPLVLLPPARVDGSGAASARPNSRRLAGALALGMVFALLPALAGAPLIRVTLASGLALMAALALASLAHRQIGGQTGDVAGATQQVAEVTMLLVLSAG